MNVIFYIAAIVAIFSTIMVISRTNAIHALLYLIVSLLSSAIIFFVLGAHFVAALEIIIYAGAIMVLFIFVVMMLNLGEDAAQQEKEWMQPSGWIVPAFLALILLIEFIYILKSGPAAAAETSQVTPKEVGISLFSTYLLGAELSAMLLMSGIIGAYHLGNKKRKAIHRFLQEGNGE